MSRAGNEVFEMHMKNLAMRMPELVRQTAVKCLGRASGEWLLDQPLPGIRNHSHLQVIEHMLCEAFKVTHPEERWAKKRCVGAYSNFEWYCSLVKDVWTIYEKMT